MNEWTISSHCVFPGPGAGGAGRWPSVLGAETVLFGVLSAPPGTRLGWCSTTSQGRGERDPSGLTTRDPRTALPQQLEQVRLAFCSRCRWRSVSQSRSCFSFLASVLSSSAVSVLAPSSKCFQLCRKLLMSFRSKKPAPAAPITRAPLVMASVVPSKALCTPLALQKGMCLVTTKFLTIAMNVGFGHLVGTKVPDALDGFYTLINTKASSPDFRPIYFSESLM